MSKGQEDESHDDHVTSYSGDTYWNPTKEQRF